MDSKMYKILKQKKNVLYFDYKPVLQGIKYKGTLCLIFYHYTLVLILRLKFSHFDIV